MKKLVLPLVIGLAAVCGCSRHYVMKLNNGMQITTASKPHLKGSTYYFKDATGKEIALPQGRVREIEPASMAKQEKPRFKPSEQ